MFILLNIYIVKSGNVKAEVETNLKKIRRFSENAPNICKGC